MDRWNSYLIPFLKEYLGMNILRNLKYENEQIGLFYLILPRFDGNRWRPYEPLLKAYYEYAGRLHKYEDYGKAKAAIQATLKKSVYLMPLPEIGSKKRFRFATAEEVEENKRKQKEKERARRERRLKNASNPVSPCSSGYHSGNDDSEVGNIQVPNNQITNTLDDIINNPQEFIGNWESFDDLFNDLNIAEKPAEQLYDQNLPPDNPVVGNQLPDLSTLLADLNLVENMSQFNHPVSELKMTPVTASGHAKKYWLCTRKVKIESTLQLICESRILSENEGCLNEGTVVIPQGVFEAGQLYDFQKSFELNGVLYCFFSSYLA